MEVEALPVSISSVGTSPPRNRKRRSSTSSTSLSPAGFASKENNCLVSKSVAKRKRTISESKQQEKQQQQIQQLRPTFWGWSPKQAKFKPKVMDGDGSLSDHPNPDSLALRSKWQPIVIESFYYLNNDNSSNHSKCDSCIFTKKSFFKSKLVFR
jgi:hypothetical protein